MHKKKVLSVFGTRPEAIKMAPVVKKLAGEPKLESEVLVTGQHQSMLSQVLDLFDIEPDYDLEVMVPGQTLARLTSRILTKLDGVLKQIQPDLILVHGDTATTFSSALTAVYNQLSVGHVEAGLRSYNRYSPYPEEFNRRLVSRLADLHFAPTANNRRNLREEGIDEENILVTGNSVVDALQLVVEDNYSFAQPCLQELNFADQQVLLVTAHRRENWGQTIGNLCRALQGIIRDQPQAVVVFPLHLNPDLQKKIKGYLQGIERIKLLPPLDYREFINLMGRSALVVTDSGGLQEEAPGLNVPVVVVRETTERQEGLERGTLKLAGTDQTSIKKTITELLTNQQQYDKMVEAANPYGDGRASGRITAGILYYFGLCQFKPEEFVDC